MSPLLRRARRRSKDTSFYDAGKLITEEIPKIQTNLKNHHRALRRVNDRAHQRLDERAYSARLGHVNQLAVLGQELHAKGKELLKKEKRYYRAEGVKVPVVSPGDPRPGITGRTLSWAFGRFRRKEKRQAALLNQVGELINKDILEVIHQLQATYRALQSYKGPKNSDSGPYTQLPLYTQHIIVLSRHLVYLVKKLSAIYYALNEKEFSSKYTVGDKGTNPYYDPQTGDELFPGAGF